MSTGTDRRIGHFSVIYNVVGVCTDIWTESRPGAKSRGEKSKLHLKVKVSQVQKGGEAVWLQAETMEGKTQVREGIMQVR